MGAPPPNPGGKAAWPGHLPPSEEVGEKPVPVPLRPDREKSFEFRSY